MKIKLNAAGSFFFAFLLLALIGCSGGGSDGSERSIATAGLEVTPESHDFGVVTVTNFPAPLEVKIQNSGAKSLAVSEIELQDTTNFEVHLGGSKPCPSWTPTISGDNYCTVEVGFIPTAIGSYDAALIIHSNAANTPAFEVPLSGDYQAIDNYVVRINQVETESCNDVTAYVSVSDQGNYAVTDLLANHFSVSEDGASRTITDFSFQTQILTPISVALAMDYSGSVTDFPEVVADAEESAGAFVDKMRDDDEVEIIKFGSDVEVYQEFTSDKDLLIAAITSPADHLREDTRLYDAAWRAVEDTAVRQNIRKAVILLTDGVDIGPDGKPISDKSLDDVIDLAVANNVPIFTIALGDFSSSALRQQGLEYLRQMAADTGGMSFDAPTADNLKTIYQQLASVLFENQYVISYTSNATTGLDVNLEIQVEKDGITGSASKSITPCP